MISIIIPVLNEEKIIERLLNHLGENCSEENITDIRVVDGGSDDNTIELVRNFSENSRIKIQLLSSAKGRAVQMNEGAKAALGRILYFLHADSFPPKNFDISIISEVEQGNIAGCFRMKFDSNHPLLKFSQWFTRINKKFCRGGDQSLFVTRDIFQKLNGFNEEYTIYEDCEFINRIYDQYRFMIIPDYVITSSRRYRDNGTFKLQYHFTIIHFKKTMGASPESLYQYYLKYIAS